MGFFNREPKPFGPEPFRPEPRRTPIKPQGPVTPPAPKKFFEEKKEWQGVELKRRLLKSSPEIPGTGGKFYTKREREKMAEKEFPWQRFGSHISEQEARIRLRELRKAEFEAKTGDEKIRIGRLKRYLEKQFDLGGKY